MSILEFPTLETKPGFDRLFVTVGTDYHRFDRLIDWIDEWLATDPPVAEVLVQRGTATQGKATSVEYLQRAELIEEFRQASVVVCHGGPATILECRNRGIIPIVVPRESRFEEHVNDHQVDFCVRLAAHKEIELAQEKDVLFDYLDAAVARGGAARAIEDGHKEIALANFEQAISELMQSQRRSMPRSSDFRSREGEVANTKVLFLGSVPRSGTTLIADILNEHHHVTNVGELVHLWQRGLLDDELCGCGEPFSGCPFWSEVGERAFGGWAQLSPERMVALQGRADRTRWIPLLLAPKISRTAGTGILQYGMIVERIVRAIAEMTDAPVVLDTSKHVSTALLLRSIEGIDLKVVHVVRDPRGVAHSWNKVRARPEATTDDAQEMAVLKPWRVALRWVWFNWAFSSMDRLGVPVHLLRYEDFVHDPDQAVADIFSFAGVDPAAAPAIASETELYLAGSHSVAGNPNRLERTPVHLSADEAWRDQLPTKFKKQIEIFTGPMLSRFRYLRDSALEGTTNEH